MCNKSTSPCIKTTCIETTLYQNNWTPDRTHTLFDFASNYVFKCLSRSILISAWLNTFLVIFSGLCSGFASTIWTVFIDLLVLGDSRNVWQVFHWNWSKGVNMNMFMFLKKCGLEILCHHAPLKSVTLFLFLSAELSITPGTHWSSGGCSVVNCRVYFAMFKSNLQNKKVNK